MGARTLRSCLAPQIERFIQRQRLSGCDYHSQALLLAHFDRFLLEHHVQEPRISRETCDRYQRSLARLAPRSRDNSFGVVRQLCEYLARDDPLSYIPEPLRTASAHRNYRPYIFTHEQIRALLAAAARLPPPASLRPHTYRTLLGLLYSTGIRIGEAFALNIADFFPTEQRLYIAKGKFRKARWVALSASTTVALEQYLARRISKGSLPPDSPLLLNERRQRLCHPTVHGTFRGLLNTCGIVPHAGKGPRLHDLRHTFAIHRLLAWYRDGEDVNTRLPALATYLGHVDIHATQLYLQPTAELLRAAEHRFHHHYLKHLGSTGDPS